MFLKKIETYKKKLNLTKIQREVLVGLLLGDACLETQNNGRTYRLKIEYSLKNKEYCKYIYNLFQNWVLTPPRERIVKSGIHTSVNITFNTLSHEAFRFYAQQFYHEKRKVVPRIIHKLLTPSGLACWYMDDGSIKSKQSKGLILNTQGFVKHDIKVLINTLKNKYNLNSWERKQKEGYQIYISGYDLDKFLNLIHEYIIPSMWYKIPKQKIR